jgi:hypothetical protein
MLTPHGTGTSAAACARVASLAPRTVTAAVAAADLIAVLLLIITPSP